MDESKKHCYRPSGLLLVPVFVGWLSSLFFCVFAANKLPCFMESSGFITENQVILPEIANETPANTENTVFFAQKKPEQRDIILEFYRQPENKDLVIEFFTENCTSSEIAAVILENADRYNVSPALAFALSWEESRLNPLAVNTKNRDDSIDRGLFQLNNRSFPRLDVQDFFNPEVNARYGMSHLRHCLDTGGTEIAALAMYNAGTGRVSSAGTPKTTLDYVSRILENRREIESRFGEQEYLYRRQHDMPAEIASAKAERPRFIPLMPLFGIPFNISR